MRVTDLLPWSRGRRSPPETTGRSDHFGLLQSEINRAFEQFWQRFEAPMMAPLGQASAGTGTMPVDVRETDQAIEVKAELPGMDEGEVDVSIADGALIIRGEKKLERAHEGEGFMLRERSFGRTERILPLPDGLDLDAARAEFRRGVLTVTIPKAVQEQQGPKRIQVKQQ